MKKLRVSSHHGIQHLLKLMIYQAIRQNISKAKELLKEEGYGPGGKQLKLKMLHGNGGAHVQRAVLIQAQLKAAS